jgi:hypothetical protein
MSDRNFVEIEGRRFPKREVVKALKAARRPPHERGAHLPGFDGLPMDMRPSGQRKAAGRCLEPGLFD